MAGIVRFGRTRCVAPPVPAPATDVTLSGAAIAENASSGAPCGAGSLVGGNAVGIATLTPSDSRFYCSYSADSRSFTLHLDASGVGNIEPPSVALTFSGTDSNGLPFGPSTERTVTVTEPGEFSLLTTETLRNDDSVSAFDGPARFGVVTKYGEVGAGEIVVVTDENDVDYEAQIGDAGYVRNDGSMFHAVVEGFFGEIAADGTKTLRIQKTTGTYDATPVRTISDLTARDLRVVLTDVREIVGDTTYGSGEFYWEANDYATVAERVRDLGGGKYCSKFMISGPAKDASDDSIDNNIWIEAFVYIWANPDGSAYGVEVGTVLISVAPWMNVASTTGLSYKAALYDGATLIRDFATTKTFVDANVNTSTDRITLTGHGYESGTMVRPTNSGGALPGGLTSGTLYTVRAYDANTISIHTGAGSIAHAGVSTTGRVDLTSAAGGGTHTLTTYIVQPVNTAHALNGPDGKSDWLTGAPSTVRLQLSQAERNYWIEAGAMQLDNTVTATPGSLVSFRPGGVAPLRSDVAGTGEYDGLGFMGDYDARAFLAQDAQSLRAARVAALHGMGIFMNNLLNEQEVSGHRIARIPCFINGSDGAGAEYATLGDNYPTAHYFSDGNRSGMASRAGHYGSFTPESGDAHAPDLAWYPFLHEGAPHWKHFLWRAATHGMVTWPAGPGETSRNFQIGATTYYGKRFRSVLDNERGGAWSGRGFFKSALLGGACDERDMFRRLWLTENMAYCQAMIAWKGAGFDLGFWSTDHTYGNPGGVQEASWQHNFHLGIASWSADVIRDDASKEVMEHLAKFQVALWIGDAFSVFYAPFYYGVVGRTCVGSLFGAEGAHDFAQSYDEVGVLTTANFATDGTVTFTSSEVILTEGDQVKCWQHTGSVGSPVASPPELNITDFFYARDVNVGARTCKLYTAPSGGSPITYASALNNRGVCWRPQYDDGVGTRANSHTSGVGYHAISRSALRLAKKAGSTNPNIDAAVAEVDGRFTGSHAANPKYSGPKLAA